MIEYLSTYWSEIFAVVTGLIYIFLEVKQNKYMWIVGLINSLVFVYVFFAAKIYANMGIYVYYVVISIYGYFRWSRNDKIVDESVGAENFVPLQSLPTPLQQRKKIFILIVVSLILSAIIGYILANFTDSPIPYFDGLTASFSIVATWMLSQKIIQHWYFWIGINIFCVPLYASQGLYLTAFLFLVYFIMSIIGLQQWKKDLQKTL